MSGSPELSRRGLLKGAGLAGVSAALGMGARAGAAVGTGATGMGSTALPAVGAFAVREHEGWTPRRVKGRN